MTTTELTIDCQFSGGNIIVDAIEGDVISLHQDPRDTPVDWFYWYFQNRGAAGSTLEFRFAASDAIGVRGPAVSTDNGKHWTWLGADAVKGQRFRFTFPHQPDAVHFSFTIPYLESHLSSFLTHHASNTNLQIDTLCRTGRGREVELLHLGQLDRSPAHRVLLTSRHHACESIASFSLEGLLEEVLAGQGPGQWLREHVEFLVIPFVDKDGVEDGDQGKRRDPHDHWEDYLAESMHPTVRAIRQLLPVWSSGRLHLALDFHCPWIRGKTHEVIHFVGTPDRENWRRVGDFCSILEQKCIGPLPYRAQNNLPFGAGWNNVGPPKSFERWAETLQGIRVSTVVEVPYANVEGAIVTPEAARALGRDLATALCQFLSSTEPDKDLL